MASTRGPAVTPSTSAHGATARVRLTDQALVAVALARRAAAGRGATVVHLLLGLAAEPDGTAAGALRRHDAAAARLAGRAATAPPRAPTLETAVGWAARSVEHRPLWTGDLLAAALEVGGGDLADLLAACGLDAAALTVPPPEAFPPWAAVDRGEALAETHGYDPTDRAWTPPAARAVARARAVGGGAATLVVALAAEEALAPDAVPLDAHQIGTRLRAHGSPAELRLHAPDHRDRGLDAVVDAARRSRAAGRPVTPADLLRAALLVGGEQPAALLALPVDDR